MAQDKAGVSPMDILGELRTNTAAALELLRSLGDTVLDTPATEVDRAAVGPFYPTLQTLGQFIDEALIGHLRVHRESLRATVGGSASVEAKAPERNCLAADDGARRCWGRGGCHPSLVLGTAGSSPVRAAPAMLPLVVPAPAAAVVAGSGVAAEWPATLHELDAMCKPPSNAPLPLWRNPEMDTPPRSGP